MAKKASGKKGGASAKPKKSSAKRPSGGNRSRKSEAGDAFIALLQSPLVADLVAVAATSALAALASSRAQDGSKGAGETVKKAGKAAADAIKRRLTEEVDAIKQAANDVKDKKATKA